MILVYHFLTKKNPYFNNKSILNDRQLEIKIPGAFKALDKIPLSFSLRFKKKYFLSTDDDSVHSVRPCPVSRALVDDFSARCLSCPYSVSCLDCEMELSDHESLQSHMSLSTGTHILTTRSSLSKVIKIC